MNKEFTFDYEPKFGFYDWSGYSIRAQEYGYTVYLHYGSPRMKKPIALWYISFDEIVWC